MWGGGRWRSCQCLMLWFQMISKHHYRRICGRVKRLIAEGVESFDIIEEGLMPGVDIVGKRFQEGSYFLARIYYSLAKS